MSPDQRPGDVKPAAAGPSDGRRIIHLTAGRRSELYVRVRQTALLLLTSVGPL